MNYVNKSQRKIINIEESLERFDGMQDLYDDLAKMFLTDDSYTNEQLQILLNEKKFKEACSYVHKLKGVAGTLGLEQLFDTAKEVNDYLKKYQNDTNKIDFDFLDNIVHDLFYSYLQTFNELKKLY